MSNTVEQIKERLEINEVIGSYIKLEKAGGNFKAKCPFHNEKTPSFFVSPSRGGYYCFGCGAKGDIFTFVEEFEGTDFMGALKILAERAGVEIEPISASQKQEKDKYYEILERATIYFESLLSENKTALSYLKKRGIEDKTIKEWRLGWANDEWREASKYLKEKGQKEEDLLRVGLIKKSPDAPGKEAYDVFRGRIIFPIFDSGGRVIGFSGRILEEKENAPKYLNTPESPLFHKGKVLYGINKAKTAIRKSDYAILVEGQMDFLTSFQAGFANTVATSGTAFTEDHLRILQKLSNRVLMAFDSDSAGFLAAKRSAELALSLGMEVKIADLPKGTDPAELILKDLDQWKEVLRKSKHLIDFYLDHILEGMTDKRKIAKEIEVKILPLVAVLGSSIERSHFVSQISKKTGIKEEAIWDDLRKVKLDPQEQNREREVLVKEEKKRKNYIERRLSGLIFWQESLKKPVQDVSLLKKTIDSIAGSGYSEAMLKLFKANKDEAVFEAEAQFSDESRLKKDLDELLNNFEEDVLREKFADAMKDLQVAESKRDEAEIKKKMEVCQELSNKLSALSKRKMGEMIKN